MNGDDHAPPRRVREVATTRLDRRVVLKAAAAFGAMSVVGGAAQVQRAEAQDGPENWTTREGTWVAADNAAALSAGGAAQVFASDFPFYAIGAHWDGEVGTWPVIELSVSPDGVTYGEPFYLAASTEDAGQPERDGRLFTPLVFTEGASFVQYRTLDIDGAPGEVAGLAFTYIDATNGPWQGDVARVSLAAADPSTPPPIISRAEWGADEAYRYASYGEIWPPEYATVEKVIIHHTETPNSQDPVVAMRSIYYYHAVTRGWGDIGYNYLVDRFGNIYEGRAGGQNVIGGHAYQFAIGSSGVGTIGNFALQDVSAEAQAGIVAITAWVGRDLDPLGTSDFHEAPDLPTIYGHRDVNQSTCPGDLLYDDLPTIRQYVAQVLSGDPTGPPGGLVIGDTVKVDADSLSLRSAPSTTAGLIATLPYGTTGVVVDGPQSGEGVNWYQIQTSLGTGWASADFLVLAPPDPPPGGDFGFGDNVVTTQSVNLRSSPSTSAAVITTLASGAQASIVDGPRAAGGYDWYLVRTASYGDGWLISAYLRLADTNTTPTDPKFAVGDFVKTNSSGVALRARPGLANSIIATMPLGTQL
ncbi:MAG: SH3 domain-containing protein, partial [Chloroflexota bacterium]|nr:SH3 domain-containing protein [Chloroflexota bacterium]